MPTKHLEGEDRAGGTVMAEESSSTLRVPWADGTRKRACYSGLLHRHDQYFKRDDVGTIYQMNVAPVIQRGLVGSTLLKAMFEAGAYGCRLSAAGARRTSRRSFLGVDGVSCPLASGVSRDKVACISSGSGDSRRWDDALLFPAQNDGGRHRDRWCCRPAFDVICGCDAGCCRGGELEVRGARLWE